ncbi:MAG: hypothetical protein IPI91_08960 [Flavobacteriales bacterium]|nr:hypothetical protein [Flavobacteriales bacterium]
MLGVTTYMDDEELEKNLAFIAKSLKPNGQVIVSFTNSHALDLWMRNLAKPFLALTGKKNKVMTSGVPIYPRSAAIAKGAVGRYFNSPELHLLNQTVFPFLVCYRSQQLLLQSGSIVSKEIQHGNDG